LVIINFYAKIIKIYSAENNRFAEQSGALRMIFGWFAGISIKIQAGKQYIYFGG